MREASARWAFWIEVRLKVGTGGSAVEALTLRICLDIPKEVAD